MKQKKYKTASGKNQKSLGKKVLRFRNIYIILFPVLLYYFIFAYLPIGGNLTLPGTFAPVL